jgi:hypothetical protein
MNKKEREKKTFLFAHLVTDGNQRRIKSMALSAREKCKEISIRTFQQKREKNFAGKKGELLLKMASAAETSERRKDFVMLSVAFVI